VQPNQFPRALDLARPFLAAGIPVCIGGLHVSDCIAMLPELPADIRQALALGRAAERRRERAQNAGARRDLPTVAINPGSLVSKPVYMNYQPPPNL
jgi:hypothetical protein